MIQRAESSIGRILGRNKEIRWGETELNQTVQGQLNRYINKGLHRKIYPKDDPSQAEQKYRQDFVLPSGSIQPESYSGRFNQPLVVDPRLNLEDYCRPARVGSFETDIVDVVPTPDTPYLLFTHDGQRYLSRSVSEAERMFAADEVGSTIIEVMAQYIQYPKNFPTYNFIIGRGIMATGSRCENASNVPDLSSVALGGTTIGSSGLDEGERYWGAGSRGRKVILLGNIQEATVSYKIQD